MAARKWGKRKDVHQREPDSELSDVFNQRECQRGSRIVEDGQHVRPNELQDLNENENCERDGSDHDDEADAPDAPRAWIDRDRLDPADREQHGRRKADEIEMRKRIELQTPVIARARIAECLSRSGDNSAMHAHDQQHGAEAQDDLLQGEIGQRGTERLTSCDAAPLALQAHVLLCILVGRKLLIASGVAVVAEDEGHEVRIGLRAELAGPIGRHGQADIAIEHRNISTSPARPEIAALERRPAEPAVVERRTMAILAALPIRRLSALGLRRRECRCCRPLLRRHRNGTAQMGSSECRSGKSAKQHVHDNTQNSVITSEGFSLAVNGDNVHAV
jgi:hypothetical protein